MHNQGPHNELLAEAAFSKQASVFDEQFGSDKIVQFKREQVRKHVKQYLQPKDHILELNCGTGEDAIWFAMQGHRVLATDISETMLQMARQKLQKKGFSNNVTLQQCSYEELKNIEQKFDYVFSNFGGLNCTNKLNEIFPQISSLLNTGGKATFVIMPDFCLWEVLLLFKGKFKTAFRRFAGKKGAAAKVEGLPFRCWYYNPAYVKKHAAPYFSVLSVQGLCTLVPPSYMQGFNVKYPRLFALLKKWEQKLGTKWPWKNIGDYYIITLQKKQG